ncbi:MAG: hypothetical protein J1E38_02390 [Paramuribaculum sp.]|nr:hypothetical protein [Paramuribaculum sp.]
MTKSRYLLPFIFLLLLFTACNDEVFIDGPLLPEETFVNIDSDDGEAELIIPLYGLENISLDLISSGRDFCKYYNAQGETISSDSPASELAKIVFENDFYEFQLLKQNNRLVFTSFRSKSNVVTWTFRLKYDYCVRFIYFTVTGGGSQND